MSLNLPETEKKNVYLAVAAGCMETLEKHAPGKPHSRVKRELRQLRTMLIHDLAPRLARIHASNMRLFKDTIMASEKALEAISKEHKQEQRHILLNLAGFCMEELSADDKHWRRYNKLFDLFPEAQQYKDVRSGDRIFTRINSELQILVAMRGGEIV